MKTLIVYASITGNTQKLAEAIHHVLGGEKTLAHIDEPPAPIGYDLVVVGFWLQGGKPDLKSAKYLAELKAGTKLFLFATHGAAAGSDHVVNAMAHAQSLAPTAQLTGTFSCPGQVSAAFLETARKKNPPLPWIQDAPAAQGHPDKADIEELITAMKAAVPDAIS